jgi:hypothetical protein
VIVDHERAPGSIVGDGHDGLVIPPRHGTRIDYDPVRSHQRQKTDLPSTRALDLAADVLGGLRIEAEGLEILRGPDGEGRGRPIRTVQPSQRGCRQARCRSRVA